MKINHANQISALQNCLINMESSQGNKVQNNKNNNAWQRRGPLSEKRLPNPLESTKIFDRSLPYFIPCDNFHDEAICVIIRGILDSGKAWTSYQINIVGKEHHLPMEDWMEVIENSHDVETLPSSYSINNLNDEKDLITELHGEKPSLEHVLKIMKDKGISYEQKNKEKKVNQITPRVSSPV